MVELVKIGKKKIVQFGVNKYNYRTTDHIHSPTTKIL